jgi:hypothetical protein
VAAHRAVGGEPTAIDWPEWHDDLPGNVLGCAHAFTALAPMPWWAVLLLKFKLTLVKCRPSTDLRKHHFVYFGRWTLLPRIGGTAKRGERYILIETNFNGSFAEYLDTLAVDLAKNMMAIWGKCYECPPDMKPPSRFRRWGRRHELAAQHYYCAYPYATVKQIETALVEQDDGSPADAETAIREMPKFNLLRRLRGFPGRLLWPDRVSPFGAHPSVARRDHISAVTVLAPIIPAKLEALRRCLARIEQEARSPDGQGSPFESVKATHVARWVIVDQLVNEKLSAAPLDADPPQLLFGAVGDGKPRQFLRTLCEELREDGREVWTQHCEGADATHLYRYLRAHRHRGGLLYAGYRARTDVIEAALRDSQVRRA